MWHASLETMKAFGLFASASVLVGAAMVAVACSSTETKEVDDDPPTTNPPLDSGQFDSTPSPDSGLGEMTFRPDEVFSGVDGTHAFKIPIAVYDGDTDLELTASDPSAFDVTPAALQTPTLPDGTTDNGKYYFLGAKKAGSFTVTAKSKGRTTTAKVTIVQYAANRWADGEKRYKTGSGQEPPCTNCHVNGQAIDHSPAALASVNDEGVAAVILTGIKPNNTPIQGVEGNHQWKVSDTEKDGLVTYLRALDPRGFK